MLALFDLKVDVEIGGFPLDYITNQSYLYLQRERSTAHRLTLKGGNQT